MAKTRGNGIKLVIGPALILLLFSAFACEQEAENGPFDLPDGIYEGASDLYD